MPRIADGQQATVMTQAQVFREVGRQVANLLTHADKAYKVAWPIGKSGRAHNAAKLAVLCGSLLAIPAGSPPKQVSTTLRQAQGRP